MSVDGVLQGMVVVLGVLCLAACAYNESVFVAAPPDADGGSVVYIYRPSSTSNFMMSPTVVIDDVEVFKLGNGDYRYVYLQPGDHTFSLKATDQYTTAAAVGLKVEKDTGSYLRVNTLLKFEAEQMNTRKFWLEIVDESSALPEIAKTEYAGTRQHKPAADGNGNGNGKKGFSIDRARDPFASGNP